MRVGSVVLAAVLAASTALSAVAATVTTQQGQVLLNRGQGFKQVPGSAQAGAGAKVVANPGGLGQVTYPDGCTVTVQPCSVYTIAQESPCKTGVLTPNTTFAI